MTTWQSRSDIPILCAGDLHLWRFDLTCSDEVVKKQQILLSVDESVRAERLLDPQKKQYFISARSSLRQLMGLYLRLPPNLIQFRYNTNGKPSLATEHNSGLFFNLSHSASLAVVAISEGSEVGVDIEKIDPTISFQQLAARYFEPSETKRLGKFSQPRQRRGFYQLWTQKEAALKREGSGFSSSVQKERLRTRSKPSYVRNFFVGPGYAAAVATKIETSSVFKSNFPVCHSVLSFEE